METIQNGSKNFEVERRPLGNTGLAVSVVGFGASPLGDVFGKTDPAEGVSAVHYAIERGINLFDVSPFYGLTLAETRLGDALAGYREKAVLSTKCGRYGMDEFDFSARRITSGLEDSLRRLRTGYVDLLQAHDVEFGEVDTIVDETIPAMRKLQQQGKARFIGITGYSLRTLIEIASRAEVDCLLTYCRYNLMIDDMEDKLLPFAQQHGIGVINASALHMGILTERGAPEWHPAPREVHEAGRKVMTLCEQHGVDGSEVALRYAFDHPGVASTLVGMSTRQHVESSLNALQMRPDVGLLGEIKEVVRPVHNRVWPSGRKENHG